MKRPFVFVSSIVSGMESLRASVKQLIEDELGYDVVISEVEGSKTRTPVRQCKKWSFECDIYIGIFGSKYGSIIPNQGVSVTEIEFNEARKDNPEKVLIYVAEGEKDTRQKDFIKRLEDFSEGYFRRKPYTSNDELINGIREDLAEFVKDRLDLIRKNKLQVRTVITPSAAEYVTVGGTERSLWMKRDIFDISRELGFAPVNLTNDISKYFVLLGTKKFKGRKIILFSIWVLGSNPGVDTFRSYNNAFQTLIYGEKQYQEYPDRFTIFLVQGNTSLRILEKQAVFWGSMTCFKVAPGLYFGPGLGIKSKKRGGTFLENMLFISQVRNKEIMTSKLVDALDWISTEFNKIDFRCNNIKPFKFKPLKYRTIKRSNGT
jgi:hypothetical protein